VTGRRNDDAPHLAAGRRAETLAERYLTGRGLRTVARNFCCRTGELDLVMEDGPQLVIVEIRYRRKVAPVAPAESITPRKRQRLGRATQYFLQCNRRYRDRLVRFDVVAVTGSFEHPRLQWIPAAFDYSELP
jgi:putative endonuclease